MSRYARRAGIICGEGAFLKFLEIEVPEGEKPAEVAARRLRRLCGIRSRSELDTDPVARQIFIDLEGNYKDWLQT